MKTQRRMNQILSVRRRQQQQSGVSLIEVMVGLTIGLLILTALITLFSNISQSNSEQFKASMQLENGRYAMDLLGNDIRLAGFYGDYGAIPAVASGLAALPDPCDTTLLTEGNLTDTTTGSPLAFYIQTYTPASLTATASIPTACAPWMDSATVAPGSDIVVIRRLDTNPLIDPPTTTSATPVAGQFYVQTKETLMDLQLGAGSAIDTSKNAKGNVSDALLMRKDFSQAVTGSPPLRPLIAASIRKLQVHVYFIAKCRTGSGSNGKCISTDDSIPTLKRLDLTASSGAPAMSLVPLVEGIEFMKVYLGIDTDNNGQIDGALVTQPASIAAWQNVAQVEIRLLARNTESSPGADSKSYDLGNGNVYTPSTTPPQFRRHAYTQQIYITNIAGRRET